MISIRRRAGPRLAKVAWLLLTVPLIAGCSQRILSATQNFTDVSAQEAFDLIQTNANNPDFILLDVRTPEEYSEGHLANAVLIDFRADNFKLEIDKLTKDKTYLVYCRTGNRSRGTLDIMAELGFENVYHLTAGITGWREAGLPVTK
ncbi:rhodanese-like domain-containing protein [Chloroflexota bacterium]